MSARIWMEKGRFHLGQKGVCTVNSMVQRSRWVMALMILCLALCGVAGCSLVGPRSISMGRADYNDAINRTEDEQMLLSIVKGRYGETFSLLAVSGVAANVRFGANAGVLSRTCRANFSFICSVSAFGNWCYSFLCLLLDALACCLRCW